MRLDDATSAGPARRCNDLCTGKSSRSGLEPISGQSVKLGVTSGEGAAKTCDLPVVNDGEGKLPNVMTAHSSK